MRKKVNRLFGHLHDQTAESIDRRSHHEDERELLRDTQQEGRRNQHQHGKGAETGAPTTQPPRAKIFEAEERIPTRLSF